MGINEDTKPEKMLRNMQSPKFHVGSGTLVLEEIKSTFLSVAKAVVRQERGRGAFE